MSITEGDCVEVMATMAAGSIDSIVTDPPYGLAFMGRAWDRLSTPAKSQAWHTAWSAEALRVARPGAYLLAFGGTRTYHRLAAGIEDAGWIIRDCLVWAYASGFPKSRSSLKPAWEPIVLARAPGPLRELAIDACRIPTDDGYEAIWDKPVSVNANNPVVGTLAGSLERRTVDLSSYKPTGGRWPANVVLTDPILDGDTPGVVGGGSGGGGYGTRGAGPTDGRTSYALPGNGELVGYGDEGTYSRFFLIPKANRTDREPNAYGAFTSDIEPRRRAAYSGGNREMVGLNTRLRTVTERRNGHPTVKPVELMQHLVRLVTPVGGTVLDPFIGSGTTGVAADLEGFDWLGIERDPASIRIAEARLAGNQRGLGLDVPAPTSPAPNTRPDLASHIPNGRAPADNYSGGWAGSAADPGELDPGAEA